MKLSPLALKAGIIALGTMRAGASPLLTNGDFSNGFAGWTVSGNVVATSGELSGDEPYGAVFNAGDTQPNAVLSQTVTTTIGDVYQLQFEYNSFQGNWSTPLRLGDQPKCITCGDLGDRILSRQVDRGEIARPPQIDTFQP